MSILSSAKSYLKNVVGGAKIVGSAIKNVFSSPAASQLSAASSALSTPKVPANQTLAPNISTPQGIGQTQKNGSIVLLNPQGRPTGSVISSTGVGSTISPAPSGSPTVLGASTNIGSSRIAADTFGSTSTAETLTGNFNNSNSSSFSGLSAPSSGGSTSGSAPSGGNAGIKYPPTPNYADVNPNLASTASLLAGAYTYDPKTGFTPIVEDSSAVDRKKTSELIRGMIPKEESVYDNREVKAAQKVEEAKQKELNNYTSELNAVVAKQQQDLLEQKHAIAAEGGTEAGWSGRSAEINYQAAVAALPLQALVATAQGNLQLAQTHLTDLTKIVSDRLDKNYQYKKAQFDWAAQYLTGEDKIKAEKLDKATAAAVSEKKDALNFAQQLVLKDPSTVNTVANLLKNPDSPTLAVDLLKVAGTLKSEDDGSSGFSSSKVESEFRGDAVSLLDNVQAGALTLSDAYTKLRKLYSPLEVSDGAIKEILGMNAPANAADALMERIKAEIFK